jgi:hypothetical protein
VHTFSGDGGWVSFTYEDHVLASLDIDFPNADLNQRNVGISVPIINVSVPRTHRRNHDGSHFSVLVTSTSKEPRPGSDEIFRAFSDAWIGRNGYLRTDGTRQKRAIAFQGHVVTKDGTTIPEVFVVDIPDDVTRPSDRGPLEGTSTQRPQPPRGTTQRRLTFTADRKYPGIQGVRHWLRSSPDRSKIAFLMKDAAGVAQIWTVSPNGGGQPRQVTRNKHDVSSAFSWSPDGKLIAHTMNRQVCVTQIQSGKTVAITKENPKAPLRPEACVISPDGRRVAYVRRVTADDETWNQICMVEIPKIN